MGRNALFNEILGIKKKNISSSESDPRDEVQEIKEPEAKEAEGEVTEEVSDQMESEPEEPEKETAEQNMELSRTRINHVWNKKLQWLEGSAGHHNKYEKKDTLIAVTIPRKRVYIDLVVDATYSFGLYYRALYERISSAAAMLLREVSQQRKQVDILWGLTLIRENGGEVIRFRDDVFTSSVQTLLTGLRTITLTGGNENGQEAINEAVIVSLNKLNQESNKDVYKGMLLFTDSLPPVPFGENADRIADFRDKGFVDFAAVYLYDHETYIPVFSWTEQENQNELSYAMVDSLEHFLYRDQTYVMMVKYIFQSIGWVNQEEFV